MMENLSFEVKIIIAIIFLVLFSSFSIGKRNAHIPPHQYSRYPQYHRPNPDPRSYLLYFYVLFVIITLLILPRNRERKVPKAESSLNVEEFHPEIKNSIDSVFQESQEMKEPDWVPPKEIPPDNKPIGDTTTFGEQRPITATEYLEEYNSAKLDSLEEENPKNSRFYVQKLASQSYEKATPELQKLETIYPGKVHLGYDTDVKDFNYKVLIGPFYSKKEAKEMVNDKKAWVRDLNKESQIKILVWSQFNI